MSPSKFQDSEVTKGVMMINGPRPSPLRINKDSHGIHKPSTSSSSSSSHHQQVIEKAKRQPVIIYTHSPKIIHAQARDFMALVQKLTGLSRPSDDEKTDKDFGVNKNVGNEENESSSGLTDEKFVMEEVKQESSSAVSPMYKVSNPYNMVDAPLFTPNSNEFFCSSRPNNSLFQSPNSVSVSPSFMDFMKGFPEY